MSEQTKIAWCDSTLNFWEGCTKVSAGCLHCYAEARNNRFNNGQNWGKGAPRRKSAHALRCARAFNRKPWICDECGGAFDDTYQHPHPETGETCGATCDDFHRRRIFSLSLGDWLDPEVPIEWLAEMLDTIRQCDQVTWILCTKRPELWRERIEAVMRTLSENNPGDGPYPERVLAFEEWLVKWTIGNPPAKIIILTSVENQEQADKRIPQLLAIPAHRRGLSLEPLLGPLDLFTDAQDPPVVDDSTPGIDWVIIGGESGHGARPCNVKWVRDIVKLCQFIPIPVFVKQLGANVNDPDGWGKWDTAKGYKEDSSAEYFGPILADKKGADPAEWPEDLRVREFPSL